jgi:4-amino-4-deoxy-L-arabinose transferase-like glycosyltransferase
MNGFVTRLAAWLREHADACAAAAIVACGLGVWWPTRDLPYHWDAAAFVVDAARDLLRAGFAPLVPTHAYFAHPPGFIALVAAAWAAFGESRIVAHAVVLVFLWVGMLALYALGRRLHGPLVGLACALAFAAVPLVEAEVGQIYFDLPVAAMAAWGLLLWMEQKPWASGAVFTAAALMKIPAVVAPGALLLVHALVPHLRRGRAAWAALTVPFVAVGGWLLYHHHVTGWWLSIAERPRYVPAGPGAIADHAALLSRVLFVDQGRWVLLVSTAAAIALLVRHRERVLEPELAWPAAIVGAGFLFFISTNEFLDRYALLMVPPYLALTLYLLRRALVRPLAFCAATVVIILVFARAWHPRRELTSTYEPQPNADLAYLDMISIARRAARYVVTKHDGAEVYGGFHEQYELREPWQGYVDHPVDIRPCDRFERHPGAEQLVYIHAYDPRMVDCRAVVDATGAVALRRFESNGKWLEIWRVP